jgi:hypothetical protein
MSCVVARHLGSAVRIGLVVDGTMAVTLVNGRWGSIQIPAGHHVIKPKDDQSGIEIDAEPGQATAFAADGAKREMFRALLLALPASIAPCCVIAGLAIVSRCAGLAALTAVALS